MNADLVEASPDAVEGFESAKDEPVGEPGSDQLVASQPIPIQEAQQDDDVNMDNDGPDATEQPID